VRVLYSHPSSILTQDMRAAGTVSVRALVEGGI